MIIKSNCVLLKLLILYPSYFYAMDGSSLHIATAHRLKKNQEIIIYTALLGNQTRIKCTANINKNSYTALVMPLDGYGYYSSSKESKQIYSKIALFYRQNHLDKKNR